MTFINTAKGRYLIRGDRSAATLRALFAAFEAKYPTSTLDFDEWLRTRGAVYIRVKGKRAKGARP